MNLSAYNEKIEQQKEATLKEIEDKLLRSDLRLVMDNLKIFGRIWQLQNKDLLIFKKNIRVSFTRESTEFSQKKFAPRTKTKFINFSLMVTKTTRKLFFVWDFDYLMDLTKC